MSFAPNFWRLINRAPGRVGLRNERTRVAWVRETLLQIPEGLRILDAGCGEKQYRVFCRHLAYVAQDFAAYDGKGDQVGLQTGAWNCTTDGLDLVCDVASIPEPDASFDAILCTEVLEHVEDPVKVLHEFSRLVKPGGRLVLTAPFCSVSHFTPFHFSTGFSRYWYFNHLPASGFKILEATPNGNFYEYVAQELRRLPAVTRRYGSSLAFLLSVLAYLALGLPLLAVLNVLTATQHDSAEILCFGYHIVAERQTSSELIPS